jgi:hypothetical protein
MAKLRRISESCSGVNAAPGKVGASAICDGRNGPHWPRNWTGVSTLIAAGGSLTTLRFPPARSPSAQLTTARDDIRYRSQNHLVRGVGDIPHLSSIVERLAFDIGERP